MVLKCEVCAETFLSSERYCHHKWWHNNKDFCPICGDLISKPQKFHGCGQYHW